MGFEYFAFYAEANLVCIIIFCMLIFQNNNHGNRTEQKKWFVFNGIAYIIYFLADIGWAAVESKVLSNTRFFVVLFNFLIYAFLQFIGYCWFMYMAASEGMLLDQKRKTGIIALIPSLVSIFTLVIAYIVNPLFWIDADGTLGPLYYPFMVFVPTLYVLGSSIISIKNMIKTEVKEDKRLYLLIAIYPYSVVFFGFLQTFALNAPLFCFGCTLMMLFFYIQSMQMIISIDPLTKLNNRGQINRYMEEIRYSKNESCCVCMIDIDKFKSINDNYGHAEGDRALTIFADALKITAEKSGVPVFIGRYGGDEFIMIVRFIKDDIAMNKILMLFREILDNKSSNLSYKIKASAGYSFLDSKEDTIDACLKRADERLYNEKHKNSAS